MIPRPRWSQYRVIAHCIPPLRWRNVQGGSTCHKRRIRRDDVLAGMRVNETHHRRHPLSEERATPIDDKRKHIEHPHSRVHQPSRAVHAGLHGATHQLTHRMREKVFLKTAEKAVRSILPRLIKRAGKRVGVRLILMRLGRGLTIALPVVGGIAALAVTAVDWKRAVREAAKNNTPAKVAFCTAAVFDVTDFLSHLFTAVGLSGILSSWICDEHAVEHYIHLAETVSIVVAVFATLAAIAGEFLSLKEFVDEFTREIAMEREKAIESVLKSESSHTVPFPPSIPSAENNCCASAPPGYSVKSKHQQQQQQQQQQQSEQHYQQQQEHQHNQNNRPPQG